MKHFFTLCSIFFATAFSFAQTPCSDLFFSEYVEGSSQNKALEVYNPTNKTIDLKNYVIKRYSNGSSTPTQSFFFKNDVTKSSHTIGAYKTVVVTNGQIVQSDFGKVSDTLYALGNYHGTGNHDDCPFYFNGNDAMTLEKLDGTAVDLIGVVGLGSKIEKAEGWGPATDTTINYNTANGAASYTISNYIVTPEVYWFSWTSDRTLVRKSTVKKGIMANPAYFKVSTEWDTVPRDKDHPKGRDIWSELGKHKCDCQPNNSVNLRLSDNIVDIYPNPVGNNKIFIVGMKNISTVEIITLEGKVMMKKQYSTLENTVGVDIPKLKSGLYLVKVMNTNQEFVMKKLRIE